MRRAEFMRLSALCERAKQKIHREKSNCSHKVKCEMKFLSTQSIDVSTQSALSSLAILLAAADNEM